MKNQLRITCVNFIGKIACAIFLFIIGGIHAQTSALDSLQQKLRAEKVDTSKAILSYKMGKLVLSRDSVKALKFFTEAVGSAKKCKEKEFTLNLLDRTGNYCYKNGFLAKAKYFFQEGVVLAREYNAQKQVVNFYTRIGAMLQYSGLSKQSIPYYDSALTFASKIDVSVLGDVLKKIGRAYYDMADYNTAMKYYLQAKDLYDKNKIIDKEYGFLLHYIGSVFKRQGNDAKAIEYYEINSFTLRLRSG